MQSEIFYSILPLRTAFMDSFMHLLTESYLILIPLLILYFAYKKDKSVIPLIVAILLTVSVVTIIKTVVAEPRPCDVLLELYPDGCTDTGYSFPSRHTAIVFSVLPFFVGNVFYFIVYGLYALFVALTRVYFGLHYPTDIIAGMIFGYLIGYFCIKHKEKIDSIFNIY
ncbi:MAG: phosphatase PAP2 family protein [DPANN group archaeon]|nr:phosphatase PAP2 family protein [DPANN group archaeon]